MRAGTAAGLAVRALRADAPPDLAAAAQALVDGAIHAVRAQPEFTFRESCPEEQPAQAFSTVYDNDRYRQLNALSEAQWGDTVRILGTSHTRNTPTRLSIHKICRRIIFCPSNESFVIELSFPLNNLVIIKNVIILF